jgi:hypothetical protein
MLSLAINFVLANKASLLLPGVAVVLDVLASARVPGASDRVGKAKAGRAMDDAVATAQG